MRVLVCGGRDLDSADVWNWLEQYLRCSLQHRFGSKAWPVTAVMHGGARGADEGAGKWAESEHLKPLVFKADWKKHGKAAGPIRNGHMLIQGKPDAVIAFPGGRGTANMVTLAEDAGVPVIRTDEW